MRCIDASTQQSIIRFNMKRSVNDKDFQSKHRTEWKNFLWQRFLEKLTTTRILKETNRIVGSLFSAYEKDLITKRIAVLVLLRSGMGVREISRVTWVAPQTISALKKSYFNNPSIYRSQRFFKSAAQYTSFNNLLRKKDWLDELFESFKGIDILELLKNPPRPRGLGFKNHRLF